LCDSKARWTFKLGECHRSSLDRVRYEGVGRLAAGRSRQAAQDAAARHNPLNNPTANAARAGLRPGTAAAAAAPLPKPTAEQLAWQEMEIGALVHFNMATYAPAGTRPGGVCSPDASTFNPALLDTDQWADSFAAFGAREAVLVVKHK
jgi:hypothetical protein